MKDRKKQESAIDIIAIGASWGGLQALKTLLSSLPASLPPIVIAQHRTAAPGPVELADILSLSTSLLVCEAEDKLPLESGRVHLAPPDYHLLVEEDVCALSNEEKVNHSRPAIDVLFESVADFYGARACGIILTGANHDGAHGLRAIAVAGGACIVQDPDGAESATMPRAALELTPAARTLSLLEIGPALVALCQGER